MQRWQWARDVWDESFSRFGERGFELRRLGRDDYWKLHEAELREHFPKEVFLDVAALRTPAEKQGQKRLEEAREDHPLADFTAVYKGQSLAAVFCGHQVQGGVYRMWHSHVHPDHRRQGIYQMILSGTLEYTGTLGFDTLISEHAPGNNAVLIAKLRAGFRIVGMEADPLVGLSVNLKYFHNPAHLAAYEFRCGLATLSPRLIEHGGGAMGLLREQFRAADGAGPEGEADD